MSLYSEKLLVPHETLANPDPNGTAATQAIYKLSGNLQIVGGDAPSLGRLLHASCKSKDRQQMTCNSHREQIGGKNEQACCSDGRVQWYRL